ncbi:MAG TPA: hypothetical protein VIJ42_09300 [Stellaceae bacterium]
MSRNKALKQAIRDLLDAYRELEDARKALREAKPEEWSGRYEGLMEAARTAGRAEIAAELLIGPIRKS